MYLSNRDIKWAIEYKRLIVIPPPDEKVDGYDVTSIDLHLGPVSEAKIWDIEAFKAEVGSAGHAPELRLGSFSYDQFSGKYLVDPPSEATEPEDRQNQTVFKRGDEVVVKPGGFLLWMTKEVIGTPAENPGFICFVNAK